MAKRNLTEQQIIKLLSSSQVSPSLFESFNVDPMRVLSAIIKNPSVISGLQKRATEAVAPLAQFDPSQTYDPSADFNEVQLKYAQMGPKYQGLVSDFWNTVAQTGNSPDFDIFYNDMMQDVEGTASQYGLQPDEFSAVVDSMNKDRSKFMSSEADRQRKQMAAFLKRRKESGLVSPVGSGSDVSDYLREVTGVGGLGEAAGSVEDYVAQRTASLRKPPRVKGFLVRLGRCCRRTFPRSWPQNLRRRRLALWGSLLRI